MNPKSEAARRRLIRRTTEIIEESEQLIRDILSWNDNVRERVSPGEPPIDVEPIRVTIAKARQVREFAVSGSPAPQKLVDELIEAASTPLM
jgi:hypothetical protein